MQYMLMFYENEAKVAAQRDNVRAEFVRRINHRANETDAEVRAVVDVGHQRDGRAGERLRQHRHGDAAPRDPEKPRLHERINGKRPAYSQPAIYHPPEELPATDLLCGFLALHLRLRDPFEKSYHRRRGGSRVVIASKCPVGRVLVIGAHPHGPEVTAELSARAAHHSP